jgi:histone arginine demethylase JMJD6
MEVMEQSAAKGVWEDAAPGPAGWSDGGLDRRDRPTRDEFVAEYVRPRKPVILTGLVGGWEALTKWSFDYFRSRYGSVEVEADGRRIPLREAIDRMRESSPERPGPYLYGMPIGKFSSELRDDVRPFLGFWTPNWLDSRFLLPGLPDHKLRRITGVEINIGGPGSPFPTMHYDDLMTQTFITQVVGRKEWVAYSPDQTPCMYPQAPGSNHSALPLAGEVPLDRFPLFAHARPRRFTLEPGETLYVPPGWWHTTRALTPSIAVLQSTANGEIWGDVKRAVFRSAMLGRRRWLAPVVATALTAYLTGFGIWKRLEDAGGGVRIRTGE